TNIRPSFCFEIQSLHPTVIKYEKLRSITVDFEKLQNENSFIKNYVRLTNWRRQRRGISNRTLLLLNHVDFNR
uniref:Uncharacterized protein n=1 Tax=Glossina palpalis gambiensis TaxID=67801 RepID=A0A1B0BQH4_9MUSC